MKMLRKKKNDMIKDMWKKKIEEKKILKSKYEIKVVWDLFILWYIVYLNK